MRRSRMTFRTLSDRTTANMSDLQVDWKSLTLIFSNILEGKGQASISSLHNPYFPKGAFADDSKEAEMIEVD